MQDISSDLVARLIALRPGMHKSAIPDVESLKSSTDGLLHDVGPYCTIECGPDDRIARVSYRHLFPSDGLVDGLHIGMTFEEALALYPTLALHRSDTLSNGDVIDEFEEGETADGLEVRLRRFDGNVIGFDLWSVEGAAASRARREEHERRVAEARARKPQVPRWKTLADPDAMLEAWADGMADDRWGRMWRRYVAWLKAASPLQRHDAGCLFNWDQDVVPLWWIIRKPDTELATATQIFFNAEPGFYKHKGWDREQIDSGDREPFDLFMEIAERVRGGFYTGDTIAMPDGRRQYAQVFIAGTAPQFEMFDRDLPGRILPLAHHDFADGVPVSVWEGP